MGGKERKIGCLWVEILTFCPHKVSGYAKRGKKIQYFPPVAIGYLPALLFKIEPLRFFFSSEQKNWNVFRTSQNTLKLLIMFGKCCCKCIVLVILQDVLPLLIHPAVNEPMKERSEGKKRKTRERGKERNVRDNELSTEKSQRLWREKSINPFCDAQHSQREFSGNQIKADECMAELIDSDIQYS